MLISKRSLKCVGILFERDETKYDIVKFRNGVPMTASSIVDSDDDSEVEADYLEGETNSRTRPQTKTYISAP